MALRRTRPPSPVFRSNATARSVFGLAGPPRIPNTGPTSRSPNATGPRPTLTLNAQATGCSTAVSQLSESTTIKITRVLSVRRTCDAVMGLATTVMYYRRHSDQCITIQKHNALNSAEEGGQTAARADRNLASIIAASNARSPRLPRFPRLRFAGSAAEVEDGYR
jgi:hypothetical protein